MNYSKYLKISFGMFVMLMLMMVVPKSGYAASLAAPEGLTQIAASTTSASISWNGVDGANSYEVSYSNIAGNVGKTWEACSTNSFEMQNLTPGTTYYIVVRAVSGLSLQIAKKEYSQPSKAIDVVTVPSGSPTITVDNVTGNSVTLSWSQVAGAMEYYVLNGTKVAGSTGQLTYTIQSLTPNVSYTFYVAPVRVSAQGYLAWDPTLAKRQSVTTGDNLKVSNADKKHFKPNISQGTMVSSMTRMSFELIPASPADKGYEIQYSPIKSKKNKKISGTISSSVIVQLTTKTVSVPLKKNTPYKYRMRYYGYNANGQKVYGKYSGWRYYWVHKVNGKRHYTYGKNDARIKISFPKVKGAKKYLIYMSTSNTSGFKKVATRTNKNRSLEIKYFKGSRINKFTRYYLKVVAKVKHGKKYVKNDTQTVSYTL